MTEHYAEDDLARTRPLYDQIREWAMGRQDVTIIGGWAVYERVDRTLAQQSRDIDIVTHTEGALIDLLRLVPELGLVWRARGRGRFYPDAHFLDERPGSFRLDVFTTRTNPTWNRKFGLPAASNVRTFPVGLVPSTLWLVNEKIRVIPRRTRDALDKRAKDFNDLYNLVFHNVTSDLPVDLRASTTVNERLQALAHLDPVRKKYTAYAEEYQTIRQWLSED